jgi:hypothetical protein
MLVDGARKWSMKKVPSPYRVSEPFSCHLLRKGAATYCENQINFSVFVGSATRPLAKLSSGLVRIDFTTMTLRDGRGSV